MSQMPQHITQPHLSALSTHPTDQISQPIHITNDQGTLSQVVVVIDTSMLEDKTELLLSASQVAYAGLNFAN
jgi:hypothetical protein